jgi:hypothetical protein
MVAICLNDDFIKKQIDLIVDEVIEEEEEEEEEEGQERLDEDTLVSLNQE